MILAIDPGPEQSAYCLLSQTDDPRSTVEGFDKIPNRMFLREQWDGVDEVVIEKIASYGMPVGEEVFETVYWSGRITQAVPGVVFRLPRKRIVTNLCGSARAKDANVRQALIDRYGGKALAIGTAKSKGPLYGMAGDCWAALAVGLTFIDLRKVGEL